MGKRRKKSRQNDLRHQLKALLEDESLEDMPDGAFWGIINERLGLEYGDAQEMIAGDPEFYGYEQIK